MQLAQVWEDRGVFPELGARKRFNELSYPYTDQPERLLSLLSILNTIVICPVAFEIFERIKQEYGFRTRFQQ